MDFVLPLVFVPGLALGSFLGVVAARVPLRRSIVLNEAKWFTVDLASRVLSCTLVGLFAWLATRPAPDGRVAATLLLIGDWGKVQGGVRELDLGPIVTLDEEGRPLGR